VYNLIIQVYISIVHLWGKMPPCYLYPIPIPLLPAPSKVG